MNNEAKNKAKELIEWFIENGLLDKKMGITSAKQCALKVCDETISELLECGEVWMKSRIIFWKQVKTEIENYEPNS